MNYTIDLLNPKPSTQLHRADKPHCNVRHIFPDAPRAPNRSSVWDLRAGLFFVGGDGSSYKS